MKVMLTK